MKKSYYRQDCKNRARFSVLLCKGMRGDLADESSAIPSVEAYIMQTQGMRW